MEESEKVSEFNNVYAHTIDNKVIHISEAESGRKGYYCLGCKGEMQARRGNIRKEHFSHDPANKSVNLKCTYSDETYRHRLAKEFLQELKSIKVPSVIKKPPLGAGGNRMIRDASFVKAHSVRIELPFYEDEFGNIRHSEMDISDYNLTEKHVYIRPDVTFFDENGLPILFIEIVATHKPDQIKIQKLRYLGIDTVQVLIPKDSPEAIKNTFSTTEHTKWLYNNEYEETDYFSIPSRNSEVVPHIDDLQNKLFETAESYECRAAQINNLIRGIRRLLESESYKSAERKLGEEIQRVERNTVKAERQWEDLRSRIDTEIYNRFSEQRGAVEYESTLLEKRTNVEQERHRELETRYFNKRGEIEIAQEQYRSPEQDEIDQITGMFKELDVDPFNPRESIERIRRENSGIENGIKRGIRNTQELIDGEVAETERIRVEADKVRANSESRIRAEFEDRRRESVSALEAGDYERVSGIQRGLRVVCDVRIRLQSLRERRFDLLRMRKLKEILDKESSADGQDTGGF